MEGNDDSSLDRTQFLLARLQELKAWQKDQEERLIKDQEEQMDQLACLPLNQIGLHTANLGDGNGNGIKGLDYANVNENVAWTDNIRRGAIDDGSYLNDDDDTIDQDLSSLTSFDGLHVIDVPSNESQFSSSNTTLLGFEMQGSSLMASQFGQTPTSGSVNQNFNMIGSNMFQLPAWAKDTNVTALPDTSSPAVSVNGGLISCQPENVRQCEAKNILDMKSSEKSVSDGLKENSLAQSVILPSSLITDKASSKVIDFDEKPILANTKTFEQLLTEKLRINDAPITPSKISAALGEVNELQARIEAENAPQDIDARNDLRTRAITPLCTGAKPFLRRGSGLARYGGISGSPEGVVRRKSKSNISPLGQMKRSISSIAMSKSQGDKEEKSRRVSTADGRINQSRSCPKISSAGCSTGKISPVRLFPSRTSNRTASKINKSPSKTLKLKSLKQQSNSKPGAEVTPSERDNYGSKQVSELPFVKTISQNGIEQCRPKCYENGIEVSHTTKTSAVISSNAASEPGIKILSSMAAVGSYDSVELSFMEKIAKANKCYSKELEDLATFEMLEDKLATNDSSVCSSISAMKNAQRSKPGDDKGGSSPIISPIISRRRPFADAGSATSTPMSNKVMDANRGNKNKDRRKSIDNKRQLEGSIILEESDTDYDIPNDINNEEQLQEFTNIANLPDPVINHNLMQDIKKFLESNNGIKEGMHLELLKPNNIDPDTEEDDTLKDDAIDGIPSDEDAVPMDKLYAKRLQDYQTKLNKASKDCYVDDESSDNSFEAGMNENDIRTKSKNVRFQEKLEKEKLEALTFSPPRIPKNSPSYLIWSIFTKEREERNRQKAMKPGGMNEDDGEWLDVEDNQEIPNIKSIKSRFSDIDAKKDCMYKNSKNEAPKNKRDTLRRRRRSDSPLSRMSSKKTIFEMDHNETAFHDALFNAKLVELNKEVEEFKKENINIQTSRRRLTADRKQLAKDIEEFEKSKDNDKKKLEEERKRLRREKTMFEKSQKENRLKNDKKSQDEIEELQTKLNKLNEELNRKETKWALALSKLQEQVKFLERENQQLHEENHKLKLKGVSAKVSSHLVDPINRRVYSASNTIQSNISPVSSSKAPSNQLFHNSGKPLSEIPKTNSVDSTMRPESISSASPLPSNNVNEKDVFSRGEELDNSVELDERQLMAFSPAESLESNVTLVSAGISDPTSIKSSHTINTEKNGIIGETDSLNFNSRSHVTYNAKSQNYKFNGSAMDTSGMKKVDKVEKNNDKVVKYYTDGSIEICCANGHRKEISPDGKTSKVFYNNGDIKETLPCGLVKYFYSGVKTWHFKYEDGREVTQFNNGKTETKFPDNTIVIDEANGDSIILLPNGQKEEHTSQYKKREYPDGTVKIVYEDGRQETRYGSGRIRKKDSQGNLVFDSEMNRDHIANMVGNCDEPNPGQLTTGRTSTSGRISSRIGIKPCMLNSV